MKLAAFADPGLFGGGERVGLLLSDGGLADVATASGGLLPPDMAEIIRGGDRSLDALRALQASCEGRLAKGEDPLAGKGTPLLPEEVAFLPSVPRPGKIIALGLNYRDHLDEGGAVHSAPIFPMAFIKVATALTGHLRPIRVPKGSTQIDYEVEVAMVIGRGGEDIAERDWKRHVFGYTLLNDVSEREIQFPELKVGLLNLGKNLPTFAPMGPWLVTADEVPDPEGLDLSCWVNDEAEPRQSSNTGKLIFGMPRLVAHFSRMGLEPGDVISTGTPSGVAAFRKPSDPWWLKPDDTVRCEAAGLGSLVNPVVAG